MTTPPATVLYGPDGQPINSPAKAPAAIEHPATARDWQTIATDDTSTAGEKPTPAPPGNDDRRTRRMRATRAEQRTDRAHALDLEAKRREIQRQDKAARQQQQRDLRSTAREDRKALRTEKRAANADRDARIKHHALAAGRRIMVIGPITAPMAVAWSSQTSYAMQAFHWWMLAALGFAAAWELSTTFTGWMYHQARKAGDRGTEYRILTWIFALGAAAMNYAHHCGPHFAPTQSAVAFSAMSITGMVLWEAYARLVHRQHLRAQGLVPKARPRLGSVRWIRYPVHSWTAWSLAILDADLDTAEKAWTSAADHLALDRTGRAVRTAQKKADRTPGRMEQAGRSNETADRRTAKKQRTGVGPDRTELTAPVVDRTAQAVDRTQRAAGPDRQQATAQTDRPTQQPTTTVDRTGPDRADRAPTGGPDRTADTGLVLTDLEQEAVDRLRSTNRSISKRSIADVVRNELGRSIGSDRAAEIARHFRTLRSAA